MSEYQEPIPMRLQCPECAYLHIDVGEFAMKPHHTHACQQCGNVWRPAIVCTVGVRFLPGFKNESLSSKAVPANTSPSPYPHQEDKAEGPPLLSPDEFREGWEPMRRNLRLSNHAGKQVEYMYEDRQAFITDISRSGYFGYPVRSRTETVSIEIPVIGYRVVETAQSASGNPEAEANENQERIEPKDFEALPAHDPNIAGGHASIEQQVELADDIKRITLGLPESEGWNFWTGTSHEGPIYDVTSLQTIEVVFDSGMRRTGRRHSYNWSPSSEPRVIAYRVADSPADSGTSADETAQTVERTDPLESIGEQSKIYSPIHEDNPDADGIDVPEKEKADA